MLVANTARSQLQSGFTRFGRWCQIAPDSPPNRIGDLQPCNRGLDRALLWCGTEIKIRSHSGGKTVRHVTRRQVLATTAGTTFGGLTRPRAAAAQDMPAHERDLYEAARREGEITWYSGQYSAETSEAIG